MSTARDRVNEQRAAYVSGVRAGSKGRWTHAKARAAEQQAAREYPTPTYERPRIVKVPSLHGSRWDVEYKVENGLLWSRCPEDHRPPSHMARFDPRAWKQSPQTPETLAALLDLFANPTETVEVP